MPENSETTPPIPSRLREKEPKIRAVPGISFQRKIEMIKPAAPKPAEIKPRLNFPYASVTNSPYSQSGAQLGTIDTRN